MFFKLLASVGIASSNFPNVIYSQLKNNPHSWKLYSLASFYWRYKGNAKEAIGEFEFDFNSGKKLNWNQLSKIPLSKKFNNILLIFNFLHFCPS